MRIIVKSLAAASLVLWLAGPCFGSDLDEWLGDSTFSQNMLELKAGVDNNAANYYGARISLALPSYASLELAYSHWQSELESSDTRIQLQDSDKEDVFQFLVNSDEWHDWVFAIGYDSIKRENVLDVEELSFQGQYSPNNWRFTGLFYSADISAHLLVNVGQRSLARSANVSRQGFGLQLGYDFSNWHWRLRYVDFQYDREINQGLTLGNLRQRVLSNLQADRVAYLSDWQIISDLQWYVGEATFVIGATQSQSLVATEAITQIYGGVDYQLNNAFSLGFFAGALPDDDMLYSELSLGYYW